MPQAFDNCVKQGGRVRTISGPDKEHGLKAGQYVHYCYLGDKGVRGEVKTRQGSTMATR